MSNATRSMKRRFAKLEARKADQPLGQRQNRILAKWEEIGNTLFLRQYRPDRKAHSALAKQYLAEIKAGTS